ncbi:SRPBCC family protein [Nocardioides sp. SYSU DS0663]|uniref:SRPBCC family protein n=1 Tax=Nocardioides sp. SYSU DS0663 TaxID=3416445 RepID=UPI003F4B77D4
MTTTDLTLEETVEIAAPPATVWSLVADPARTREWSPQVFRTVVRGRPVQEGTRFFNLNRRGPLFWPTSAKVVTFDPHVRFAFRVSENWTVWSFTLEPTATGTRLTNRREAPRGISPVSLGLTKVALGGTEGFSAELREGMRETLDRVKAEAERRP